MTTGWYAAEKQSYPTTKTASPEASVLRLGALRPVSQALQTL